MKISHAIKLTFLFFATAATYLGLVLAIILAQSDRTIDRLSLSRASITEQSLASLLTKASGHWISLSDVPNLDEKVQDALLDNAEVSAIVVMEPNGHLLASTGSQSLVHSILPDWNRSAMRHFANNGEKQLFVTRANGVEYCAAESRNLSGQTVAIVWLIRRRDSAAKALQAATDAIIHIALPFAIPAFAFACFCFWLGATWQINDRAAGADEHADARYSGD